MSSLGLRLASTMAPQSVTDLMETVHTQLGVSLWLDKHAVELADKSGSTMLPFVKLYRTRK